GIDPNPAAGRTGRSCGREYDLEAAVGREREVALRDVRDHALGPLAVRLAAVNAEGEVDRVAPDAADPVRTIAAQRREAVARVDVVAEDLPGRGREGRERGPLPGRLEV